MKLLTQRLILEDVRPEDITLIHQLHLLPQTDQFNTLGIPSSLKETQQLLNNWLKLQAAAERQSYVFTIRERSSANFAGLMALNLGKASFRIGEVWYKLHPDCWGRGFATEALHKVLDFGFKDLKLHRIEAGCATENVASIRVLEKAGMLREGSKRKVLPIRGQWVDNYEYAILEEDFLREQ